MASATINNSLQIVAELAALDQAVNGYNITVPRAGKVVDITIISTATVVGGGTLTVGKGAAAIVTGATISATSGTITRASILDQANVSFSAGDSLRLTKNASNAAATVVVSFAVDGATLTVA